MYTIDTIRTRPVSFSSVVPSTVRRDLHRRIHSGHIDSVYLLCDQATLRIVLPLRAWRQFAGVRLAASLAFMAAGG